MKWILIICSAVLIVYLGSKFYFVFVVNDKIAAELRAHPEGERAKLVMILTFPDGRELPVNYLREGSKVYVGADGRWWRALREGNVPVGVFIKGQEYAGRARTILDDPGHTREIFERLRPNVPRWIPDWADAYLVVIDIVE